MPDPTPAAPIEKTYDFDGVKAREMQAIAERRSLRGVETKASDCEGDLFGICLSGGGIRSATFNLGVLQGLAGQGLLQFADYLSTVSGGGYIGSWFQGLCHNSDTLAPKVSGR